MEPMTRNVPLAATMEKPENGLPGLKHWRYDVLAGMQVALVSLPLSLGIAIASGAPPVTGIVSSVIAGIVYPFIGGAYVTISGPAAGLAPVLLGGMLVLGNGNLEAGYPLLLVAISLTGVTQLVLTYFRAGRFAIFFPQTVVEAMLAAIGIIIIIKQFPLLLGVIAPPKKTIIESLQVLPGQIAALAPGVFLIGAVSLFLIFYLNRTKNRWLKIIPPPLTIVLIGIGIGTFFQLGPQFLIRIPDNLIESVRLPAFGEVLARPELWWSIATISITLTLIDGIESLATIQAVDKIDPYQRKSNPNRTLGAMGISNLLSSLVGGLTIIPGGIKSRANVDGGGRTLWANFYNAVFLILFFFFARDLINRIPLATLAAVLIYIGWRLCEPRVFLRSLATGKDQFIIFIATIVAILMTDLLAGIIIGVVLYVLLLHTLLSPSPRHVLTGEISFRDAVRIGWDNFKTLFQDPVIETTTASGGGSPRHEIHIASLFNTNLLKLENRLQKLPPDADTAFVLSRTGKMICHTAMEYLHHFQEQAVEKGRKCEIEGLGHYHPFAAHPHAARKHDRRIAKRNALLTTRQNMMMKLAQQYELSFSPEIERCLNEHHFLYLTLGSDKMESNVISGQYKGLRIKLFDYSFLRDPLSYLATWRTMIIFRAAVPVPDFVLQPEHYLDRYKPGMRDLSSFDLSGFRNHSAFSAHYLLQGQDEDGIRKYFTINERFRFFEMHPKFCVEARGGMILAFRVDRYLEHVSDIPVLLSLVEPLGGSSVPEKVSPRA
jgi:carbonic anhydrase